MMFQPCVALASLSGESDAQWARSRSQFVGAAFLGGIAVCEQTRRAARNMEERDREEFLPDDPIAFIDRQLALLSEVPIVPGFNIRTVSIERIAETARVCRRRNAMLEINAHCRQEEMCHVGAGEALLCDTDRLVTQTRAAAETGCLVSVKVRAEVPDVELLEVAHALESAGASVIHVDAMDTESIIEPIAAETGLFVIANNGVRDAATASEYLSYGADAVSIGRASDRPDVLRDVETALSGWAGQDQPRSSTIDRKPSPR